jgi:hypothetical protein
MSKESKETMLKEAREGMMQCLIRESIGKEKSLK